jgi:hypothetical protein
MKKPAGRVPLHLNIEYRKSYSRNPDLGKLKNISISGAFLKHTDELQAKEKINIHFKVSGRERVLQAEVIWSNSEGSGITFVPDNNRDVQIVDDLMYFVQMKRDTRKELLKSILDNVS